MLLWNERLKNAIKFDSPKGLRTLLSEYIRLSCIVEIQKSSMLDIRLEINKMISKNNLILQSKEKKNTEFNIVSKTRNRSLTHKMMRAPLLANRDVSNHQLRRSRSYSAKAAYF
jgi:hypothetical protein